MPEVTAQEWDAYLMDHPEAHLLQSAPWGLLKSRFGWDAAWVQAGDCGAQVLFRRLPLGLSLAYIPKGPVGADWSGLWAQLDALCRKRRAVFLKVEPDVWLPDTVSLAGFVPSPQTIQPPRTVVVDLSGSEDDLLARMKQKTRYNIRLAEKKGVSVRAWDDLPEFHRLMQVTGTRDGFGVHSLDYYQSAYELFHPRGECELLLAEFENQPLAALMVFARRLGAWYFYGASSDAERSRMPTYALQWEAMRWARARGCAWYDLWGIPDVEEDALEAGFEQRADGLWGVYRFKRGFGGEVRRSLGAFDRVYNPALYALYKAYIRRRGGVHD